MALGKISGPLLKDNLQRDGIDLAFETDLLYLDVNNMRVGIKTTSPSHDLQVNGTTRTTNLEVVNSATLGNIVLAGNTIYSNTGVLQFNPPTGGQVVYQNKLLIDSIEIEGNRISTVDSNANLEFMANGTGTINLNSDTEVFGNLHATGTITADGNLQIGDADTDNVIFNAEIASDILPDIDNTFKLGSLTKRWSDMWVGTLNAGSVFTGEITVDGIDIALRQGNIYYVATAGDDQNSGTHQNDPLSSLGRALDLAALELGPSTIYIYPGTYLETLPLTIPAGVTVKGAGIRSVTIQPDSDKTVDMFLLNGETTIEDLTITGFEYDPATNTGYAFKFAPGMNVTSRSPYIRNVTVITQGSVRPLSDPRGFDQGDAGRGAYLDGSVVNAASREASCLFHSVTFICPGVDVVTALNGVRIEWLNCFTYFANRGLYLKSAAAGFAGDGKTRVKIASRTGTFNVGNTLSYYDTDGTTVIASGTIQSISGDFFVIDGFVDGFETLTDRDPKTVVVNGGAKLSTVQKKFGVSSLRLDGINSYISLASQADFGYGTGDFTLEFFWRPDALGTQQVIFDQRTATTDVALYLEMNTAGNIRLFVNGSYRITSSVACTAATMNHIVLFRTSGVTKLSVNGTITPTTYTDANNYAARPVVIGANRVGSILCTGYIDELRLVKGVTKYTTSVSVPTSAFKGDTSTVLLLHFEGANNSTLILDDGVTLQDIRTSAGGTASIIDFADYSDFGVEVRAIGSANVYGNYGVYGDGVGVLGYLIGQNFAYIGSGKLSDNDPIIIPNDSTNVNEVVQFNGAKIYYTSVDNKGDFKVGDFFLVSQEDGTITFNPASLTVASPTGVTFTDGVNTTTIVPTYIETGNIKISGNTIESTTGGITLTAANSEITTSSNTTVTGNVTLNQNFNVQGNSTIGDTTADTVAFNARVNSSIVPSTTGVYDLGSNSLRWKNVYLSAAIIDDITISGNLITTTVSNSDLELRANGSGIVTVPNDNLVVNQNFTVSSGTTSLKNTNVTGTLTATNLTVNSPIVASEFDTGDIKISGNVIRTTLSNSNLELRANGTGSVIFENFNVQGSNISNTVSGQNIDIVPSGTGVVNINSNQALRIPTGTELQRPVSPSSGMIRFNSTINSFEGYNGTYWIPFGYLSDLDRNTYIIPELSPGSNENTLYFYADGDLAATLNSTEFNVNKLIVDNIEVNGNILSTTTSNTNLELRPNGTGAVVIDGFRITTNTITNTNSNAVTEFRSTGTGYYHIVGNNAVVIPSGGSFGRPGGPQVGMIRFNTDLGFVEVYDGAVWISVAGVGAGITSAQAEDIAIATVLIFG